MKRGGCRKLVSLFLSILLVLEVAPLGALALPGVAGAADDARGASREMKEDAWRYEAPSRAREVVGEAEANREADVKHFVNNDGSYTAVKYAQAVHYRDGAREAWRDIDNTPELTAASKAGGVIRARDAGSTAFGDAAAVYVPAEIPL